MEPAIHRNGRPVVGFDLDAYGRKVAPIFGPVELQQGSWNARARAKLAMLDALVVQGRGDELVQGGGCTDPGGGIMPTVRTAREMAALLRSQLDVGLGAGMMPPSMSPPSPWAFALVTSVVGATTSWVIGEIAWLARGGGRRRKR